MTDTKPSEPNRALRPLRNPRTVVGFVIAVALLTSLAFLAGWMVRTPEDGALDAAEKVLPARVSPALLEPPTKSFSGTVVAGTDSLTVAAFTPAGAERPVITETPLHLGDQITEGTTLIAISGRPVFGLKLEMPLYRALNVADSGPDVTSLERTLHRLGFLSRPPGPLYDRSTSDAITALYANAGYSPPVGVVTSEFAALPEANVAVTMVASLGSVVSPGDVVFQGATPTISATTRVDVLTGDRIELGFPVQVTPVNGGNFEGTVVEKSAYQEADPEAAMTPGYDIRVEFTPDGMQLDADAALAIAFESKGEPTLAVPLIALRSDGEGDYVIAVRERGTERIKVSAIQHSDGWVFVEAELAPSDRLLING